MKNDMLYQLTHEGFVFDYKQYPKITTINILSILRKHKKEKEYQVRFHDLYEKYQDTNFLVKHLNTQDQELIVKRYFKTVENMIQEEQNV